MWEFFKSLGSAFKSLIIKLVCSRKAFFHIVSIALGGWLIIWAFEDSHLYRFLTYLLTCVVNFGYAGIITFESVKTDVKIGVGK